MNNLEFVQKRKMLFNHAAFCEYAGHENALHTVKKMNSYFAGGMFHGFVRAQKNLTSYFLNS